MKANVASWDRIVRVVLGLVLGYLAIAGVVTGALAVILGIVGVVFLVTGIVGFCPLYAALKLSTRRA
jgi:hypothetical protein